MITFLTKKIKDALAAKDARLEALELKVEELKTDNEQQQSLIIALQQQIAKEPNSMNRKSVLNSVENTITDLKPVAATGIRKTCTDLRYMGHTSNGLYLIMGTKQVETVYCDFTVLPSDPSKTTF